LIWNAIPDANNGRDAITFYIVELYNSATGLWNQQNTNTGVYTTFVYSTGSVFPASTTYKFRIRPRNGVGDSLTTSNEAVILSLGVPSFMNPPTIGIVTPRSIEVSWTLLTDMVLNGGNLPTYYRLEWEDKESTPGISIWTEVTTESAGILTYFIYTRPSGVFPSGSTQRFRLKAKNTVGLGLAYSAEASVTADYVPLFMGTPTVSSISPKTISFSWP